MKAIVKATGKIVNVVLYRKAVTGEDVYRDVDNDSMHVEHDLYFIEDGSPPRLRNRNSEKNKGLRYRVVKV